jgi:glycosyltransferase involved in cell wall biosynthesis
MKVAVVNYAFGDGFPDPESLLASYRTLTGWAEALARAGHVVHVIQRFHRDARIVSDPVQYTFCRDGDKGRPRSRPWPSRMHRAIVKTQPDLVHVNGLDAPFQTWLLRRRLPPAVGVIVQDHASGGPVTSRGSSSRDRRHVLMPGSILKRALMRAPDAYFFTAAELSRAWQRAGLIQADQPVYQVLEASTTMRPADRDASRRESGIQGDPAVLWVGRLNENKSPLTVLEGFDLSLERLPDAVLTMIYGSDDLLPSVIQRLRASQRLASRVKLLGSIPYDRMSAFYSAADLFILGSHHEGSGYALIEACACGLPPVVTDIPTFRIITGGGAIGALWPTGDAGACSNALVSAASRDRRAFRQQVLDHFARDLSWTAVARQASMAYAEVLGRRGRR